MTSYQVMCSVLRPSDPTSLCQIKDFHEKASQHLDSVFQDQTLTQGRGGSGHLQSQNQGDEESGGGDGSHASNAMLPVDDNLMLCAVVSKTSASFSGADSFKSSVRLPFFWCNWCPFDTESKASLLQHVASQHCFVCRFCHYVAPSRYDVISHGLKFHPQFSRFREQRLRACHLKRDLFQLHFDPKSGCEEARKQAGESHHDTQEGPSSPKRFKRDSSESVSRAEDAERLQLQDEESSSESVDDLPLQFPERPYPERNGSSQPSVSEQKSRVTTHVMENIVSSSGMEPDVGTDQTLTSRSGQPETCQSPVPTKSTEKWTREAPVSTIKRETESDHGEFAHALGRNGAEGPGQAGRRGSEPAACSPGDALVCVKQEPVEEPTRVVNDPMCQQARQQGHVLSRSVSSPPLSNIRVENLQRQFEESFGVHPAAMTTSAASEFPLPEPHPVHLIAQPSRLASQGLVENFLIDTAQSTSAFSGFESRSSEGGLRDDQTSPSMLRHLLTRPLHERSCQSSVNRADNLDTEQDAGQSDELERQEGQMQERNTNAAALPAQFQDNFLLTSSKQWKTESVEKGPRAVSVKSEDLQSLNLESQGLSHSDGEPGRTSPPFIKQEREDSSEEYSTALNLMTSAGPRVAPSQEDMPVSESQDALPQLRSRRRCPQGTLQSLPSAPVTRCTGSEEGSRSSEKSPARQTASSHVVAISASETLKSWSNMSLRDLLTMETRLSPWSVKGQVAESGGDPTGEDNPVSTTQSEVVWECGFCHFEDYDKTVVLTHRRQHHAQLMEEAGMQNGTGKGDPDTWAGSSVDEEEKLSQGEGEEDGGDDHVSWMDQPSTSSGYSGVPHHFSSFPLSESHERTQRARGSRRDQDFEYLSDSTVESESDIELDNLDDKTYEPPKGLEFSDTLVSTEEEDDDNSMKKTKGRKASVDKVRKRRRLGRRKSMRADLNVRKDPGIRRDPAAEDDVEKVKDENELYRCLTCRRQPLTLQAMKDHVRYAPDTRHLLMVRPQAQPSCLQFICPGTQCTNLKTALFTECQSYLVHVLQCQGHIFDILKSSIQNAALTFSSKIKEWAGFLNCPISNCHFVSYHREQLRAHLDDHLGHLHTSQMLLFRSVCTVMAKMYGGVGGFDRYICYRCSSILIDLPRVVQHMLSDHEGQVRGVLMVTQKVESRSQGIVVAIQCLKCCMRVPSLHLWFTHECGSTSSQPLNEGSAKSQPSSASSLDSSVLTAYSPTPSIPPFQEWVWGQQSSNRKLPLSTSGCSVQKETSPQEQLPLIRSILQSHPQNKASEEGREGKLASQAKACKDLEEEEEEVTTMVQCEVCQQFVPENCTQHSCFLKGQKKVSVKREKERHSQGASPSDTPSSSQQQLLRQQLSSPADISHSQLLAVLATRHHNNPLASQSRGNAPLSGSAPKPHLASTTHPSLISLLTQTDRTSLKQSASPQPNQVRNLQLNRPANPLMEKLAQFQLMHPAVPPPAQEKAPSPQDGPPATRTIRSLLSHVLKRKLESQQDSPPPHFFPAVQDGEDCSKASEEQSDKDTAGVALAGSSQLVKERSEEERPSLEAVSVEAPGVELAMPASPQEEECHQSSGRPAPQPLMSFLRQQGDQVRQVLGNILDDQESSQS
ncbi:uncharacterized protein LOC143295129 [Babylonia areolata]|uniref:uncharacterized protein LOC143295129 n=1 Tax=Babylonia areolata TaxID=304850 RepID=UPI003FD45CAA